MKKYILKNRIVFHFDRDERVFMKMFINNKNSRNLRLVISFIAATSLMISCGSPQNEPKILNDKQPAASEGTPMNPSRIPQEDCRKQGLHSVAQMGDTAEALQQSFEMGISIVQNSEASDLKKIRVLYHKCL